MGCTRSELCCRLATPAPRQAGTRGLRPRAPRLNKQGKVEPRERTVNRFTSAWCTIVAPLGGAPTRAARRLPPRDVSHHRRLLVEHDAVLAEVLGAVEGAVDGLEEGLA